MKKSPDFNLLYPVRLLRSALNDIKRGSLRDHQDRKEEGFHRRQREGRHFNNAADWGDEAANIISSIVMEHTYENRC